MVLRNPQTYINYYKVYHNAIDSVAVVHVMTACVSRAHAVIRLTALSGSQTSITSYNAQCCCCEREREEK